MTRSLLTCVVLAFLLGLPPRADADDAATRRGDQAASSDHGKSGATVGTAVPRNPAATPATPAPAPPAQTSAAPKPVEKNADNKASGRGTPVGEAVPRSTSSRPRPHDGDDHDNHHGHNGSYVAYGSGYYGGYYGPYDPWYGSYPAPAPVYAPGPYIDAGAVRLKVKPVEAEVYVDGYYAGIVDDFDGVFQKLRLDAGPHRIEMKAPGFETLGVDIRIEPDHTTTYRGNLATVQ